MARTRFDFEEVSRLWHSRNVGRNADSFLEFSHDEVATGTLLRIAGFLEKLTQEVAALTSRLDDAQKCQDALLLTVAGRHGRSVNRVIETAEKRLRDTQSSRRSLYMQQWEFSHRVLDKCRGYVERVLSNYPSEARSIIYRPLLVTIREHAGDWFQNRKHGERERLSSYMTRKLFSQDLSDVDELVRLRGIGKVKIQQLKAICAGAENHSGEF